MTVGPILIQLLPHLDSICVVFNPSRDILYASFFHVTPSNCTCTSLWKGRKIANRGAGQSGAVRLVIFEGGNNGATVGGGERELEESACVYKSHNGILSSMRGRRESLYGMVPSSDLLPKARNWLVLSCAGLRESETRRDDVQD